MDMIQKLVLALIFTVFAVSFVQAQCPKCGRTHSHPHLNQLAEQKSHALAQMGRRIHYVPHRGRITRQLKHVGGSIGSEYGVRAEGVGYSSVSPSHAVRVACYSGFRDSKIRGPYKERLGTSVVRGKDGWYATIFVR